MSKKPSLTVINPATIGVQPPFILGKHGRALLCGRVPEKSTILPHAPEFSLRV